MYLYVNSSCLLCCHPVMMFERSYAGTCAVYTMFYISSWIYYMPSFCITKLLSLNKLYMKTANKATFVLTMHVFVCKCISLDRPAYFA